MAQQTSGRRWSIARVTASALLLVMALVYAGITALFVFLLSSFKGLSTLRFGNDVIVLYREFAYSGSAAFLALCLLSGYAGLAALCGWRGARLVGIAAGFATIALGLYGLWLYANLLMIGLPFLPFSIGIQARPWVFLALCVVGILVLWATHKAVDKTP
jgi:hypothetical protein